MSRTIHHRLLGNVVTALAGALSLAAGASAQWILIDDFNAGHDDAWTRVDLLEGTPWGPTIYDASTGEYHISSTEPIPPQNDYVYTTAYWTESAGNPAYSDGFVRAKVRMDTAATHPSVGMRFDPELINGYAFAVNQDEDIIAILRTDGGEVFTLDYEDFVFDVGRNYILEGGAIGQDLSARIWAEGDPIPPDPQVKYVDDTYAVGAFNLTVSTIPGTPHGQLSGYFDDVWFLPVIPGDIDGDGDVDLTDLAMLLAAYGSCEGDPAYNPDADLDDSGCVDLTDLGMLLANYGYGA